jgi:hypothetical protein
MNNQNTPNPDQLRDRASQNQQQLLQQYLDLIAENVHGATIQAVNDQLTHFELLGIQKGYRSAKREVTAMMQERLNQLNQQNSEKIIQMRAALPELPEFDDDLGLEAPSLQEGIDASLQNYGVLSPSDNDNDLPDDLSQALEA